VAASEVTTIGSDHSPSPPEMKLNENFFKVWGGISGVQHTLSLVLTGIRERLLSQEQRQAWDAGQLKSTSSPRPSPPLRGGEGDNTRGGLELIAELLCANVARRFQIPNKGDIAVGFDADLALVDLREKFTVRAEDLRYRHRHSPYVGRTLTGRVVRTILRGQTIFQRGQIAGRRRGQLIKPI
jgi:allantoinase